jgi:hypothetical protein
MVTNTHHCTVLACSVKTSRFPAALFLFFVYLTKVYVHPPHHGSFLAPEASRLDTPSNPTPDEILRTPEYRNNKKFWCAAGGGYVDLKMMPGNENGVWVQFEYRDFKD